MRIALVLGMGLLLSACATTRPAYEAAPAAVAVVAPVPPPPPQVEAPEADAAAMADAAARESVFETGASTAAPMAGDGQETAALTASTDAFARVVDVGQGLCVLVRSPTGNLMVYDTGEGGQCEDSIDALLPAGEPIALMVLSHTDDDHIKAAPGILSRREVKRILWTGKDRETGSVKKLKKAIDNEGRKGAVVEDLSKVDLSFGKVYPLDELTVTLVAGWGQDPFGLSGAEAKNVKSIVVRVDYGQDSLLLTGDTVGKQANRDDECADAEQYMVEHRAQVPVRATVMTAPHHGADNGSSACFIAAVAPQYVVFSAGHNGTYRHPRKKTALRYRAAGVPNERMFRTDRGDDEGPDEWAWLRKRGHHDRAGDDHVDIHLRGDGAPTLCYADSVQPVVCE